MRERVNVRHQQPKHGEIIVFRYPADISQTLVKRLIGMPGDRIKISDGVVYRNGERLNESYVYHKYAYEAALDDFPWPCCHPVKEDTALQAQQDMLRANVSAGEVIVPKDHYFGMGDNRDNSSDSRYWGFIPRENIIGKPFLVYWSYRASAQDLTGATADSVLTHTIDIAEHFFSRTRWDRTLKVIRGFPDSELPKQPLPVNPGLSEPLIGFVLTFDIDCRYHTVVSKSTELLQGTLDLLILRTLECGPLHGVGISDRVEQVTKGVFIVGPGSLFPALHRLAGNGWIEGEWSEMEKRRVKTYTLTTSGRAQLVEEKRNWRRVLTAMNRMLAEEV